ncbi:hypothetical protein Droror1_Dr00023840 [Drosera rotundifolia]
MFTFSSNPYPKLALFSLIFLLSLLSTSFSSLDSSLTYVWPLPSYHTSGADTFSVDPYLSLSFAGDSQIVTEAFERYRSIIFKHVPKVSGLRRFLTGLLLEYDISVVEIVVDNDEEELKLGVDESYTLVVEKKGAGSIVGAARIKATTVYGALRGLETFSQLCVFDFGSKSIQIPQAPWDIQDEPRFMYRGLLVDTSRHYIPVDVLKHIIESMSYAKLNVLHWHIIDEESFPLEVPTYPYLWEGAYSKWERYTVEDGKDIVNFAKMRGIHVMAEVDIPGHAESWGVGYPDLWPSSSCREPLDVSKNFTFDVVSGILADLRKIFPFELLHLGGDEVHTDCWSSTPHVSQWLQEQRITTKDAYKYFVLRAQKIAISMGWRPVNWEETFNTFASDLSSRTVVHNWLGPGVCPEAVAKGFQCIFSNQGVWYLDHLDVPWDSVYNAEPLEGINDVSAQKLVLGGEVCMWGETADTSDVQQTIWPRAAAAAERLWSKREALSAANTNITALSRLHYFRCLLNMRGVQAAPVTAPYGRSAPYGPGSCYAQ